MHGIRNDPIVWPVGQITKEAALNPTNSGRKLFTSASTPTSAVMSTLTSVVAEWLISFCTLHPHLLFAHLLPVQVYISYWFWFWRAWGPFLQLAVSVDLRGRGRGSRRGGRDRWRGGAGSTMLVCRGGRGGGCSWRRSWMVTSQEQRLLPKRLILWGELLPLPPNTG